MVFFWVGLVVVAFVLGFYLGKIQPKVLNLIPDEAIQSEDPYAEAIAKALINGKLP